MDERTNAMNSKLSANERPSRKVCSVLAGQEKHKNKEKSTRILKNEASQKSKGRKQTAFFNTDESDRPKGTESIRNN